jgi:hypothetical protein
MTQMNGPSDSTRKVLLLIGVSLASGLMAGAVAAAITWSRMTQEGAALASQISAVAAKLDRIAEFRLATPHAGGTRADSSADGQDSAAPGAEEPQLKLDAIERRLASVQVQLDQLLAAWQSKSREPDAFAAPDQRMPLSMLPQPPALMPGLGQPPGPAGFVGSGPGTAGAELSPEGREHLQRAMQQQAARTRELIEAESMDPENPDPTELMRALQYSSEETMAELRAKLSPEEFHAIFPLEPDSYGTTPH